MMPTKVPEFAKGDLLMVVDVQKDFCPGGALPIEGGDEIVPTINLWTRAALDDGIPVYVSRDWHPRHHVSFEESGGEWPPHCVQDTDGARFHAGLEVPHGAVVVTKGVRFDKDQNSVFDQTGLAEWLRRQKIERIFIGGLAQDVCVLASVLDGLDAGFDMQLIKTATRPVDPETGDEALEKMRQKGCTFIGE
ncbi:MAG TPA: isochorismatase family protein [Desulfuromonadales bacterium]|nr:isochorismatase family protein [Desulfuromonadales bacterium]